MNWFFVIDDSKCKQELKHFLKKNAASVILKAETETAFKNIELAIRNAKPNINFIVVNSSNNMHIVKINDIIHCQSNQSYTQFYLSGGKKLTATKSLKQFETILKQHQFTRIHQSHLVNINYIEKYVKGVGGHLVLTDGTELPVAARKKEILLKELDKL